MFEKGSHYLAWGIPNVWVIDPEARTAWMMTVDHPSGVWVPLDGSLKADENTSIPLSELFVEVDKLIRN